MVSRNRSIEDVVRETSLDEGSTAFGAGSSDSIDSAKRSAASMQTPPPTSTIRRKAQERNSNVSMTPLNMSTPLQSTTYTGQPLETPSRIIGFSPNMFGLQDSPDLFGLPGNPTSASPFFARHQMPWSNEGEAGAGAGAGAGAMDISNTYGDPFGPSNPSSLNMFEPGQMDDANLNTPQLPVVHESVGFHARTMAHEPRRLDAEHSNLHSSIATSPRALPLPSEDPSMFLSSPARRFGMSEPTFSPPIRPRVETRQPYHYQTEVSEREKRDKELKKLQRSKSLNRRQRVTRVESESYISQTVSGKPPVQRSVTHSGVPPLASSRHQRQTSFSSPGPIIGGGGVKKTPSKGRTSPLKMHRSPLPHPVSLPAPMESLVLKISKDGLATTEMKLISDSPTKVQPGVHISGESSTEIESDSSDDEPDFSFARSQNPSFAFPDSTPRRPDFVRAQSTSRPHSKGSSYSSAAASTHSGRHSPWAGSTHSKQSQFSAQQEHWNQQKPSKKPTSHSRSQSITDSDLTHEEDGAGDAQHALMQVLKGRKRQTRQLAGTKQSAAPSLRSATLSALRSSPPPYTSHSTSRSISNSNSPTTYTESEHHTPTTERQNNPSTGTRCVCNSMNNGGHLMIQWLVFVLLCLIPPAYH